MNRPIKEATVKSYRYETHDQLRPHLTDFVGPYNLARRLKALRGAHAVRSHLQGMDR